MTKITHNKQLYINFHSLITIWAPDIPQDIYSHLNNRFKFFSTNQRDKTEEADITLLQLLEPPKLSNAGNHMSFLYGLWVTEYNGESAIVFNYKGKPDVIFILSNVISILYTNRPGMSRRLYGLVLFSINIALNKKNGLLFHGAMAKNENNYILLTGHRGTKKTLLLLMMLQDGWDYVSEDKVILHNNNTYLFQDFIVIRNHHLDSLPWLADTILGKKGIKKWSSLRKRIRAFAQKYLHKVLHHIIDKYCNPLLNIDVTSIFPASKIIHYAKPSIVITLFVGSTLKFERVSKTSIIDEITLIQNMLFSKSSQFESMLFLYNKNLLHDRKEIINKNLDDVKFFKLTIPEDCDIKQVYQELKNYLSNA